LQLVKYVTELRALVRLLTDFGKFYKFVALLPVVFKY